MYIISELRRTPPDVCQDYPRLFFSIYYRTGDDAFKRASENWKNVVSGQETFLSGIDLFYTRELYTENDFRIAWSEINTKAASGGYKVWAGHILTHASKQTDGEDGIEFAPDGNDGTLKQDEILNLTKLPWADEGFLILGGCNTGLAGSRGWTPAASFARSQGVPTVGQTGYAYFSKTWGSYDVTTASDTNICLWAYRRGKNGAAGGGGRMSGNVF